MQFKFRFVFLKAVPLQFRDPSQVVNNIFDEHFAGPNYHSALMNAIQFLAENDLQPYQILDLTQHQKYAREIIRPITTV